MTNQVDVHKDNDDVSRIVNNKELDTTTTSSKEKKIQEGKEQETNKVDGNVNKTNANISMANKVNNETTTVSGYKKF